MNLVSQASGIVVGILIIRGVSKSEYGYYSVFAAFLAAFILLSDSGISGGAISAGSRPSVNDSDRMSILRSALRVQRLVAVPQALLGGLALFGAELAIGAGLEKSLYLTGAFLLACVPLANRSVFIAYRRFTRDYTRLQVLPLINALVRLIVLAPLTLLALLTLPVAAIVNAGASFVDVFVVRRGISRRTIISAARGLNFERELWKIYRRALPLSIVIVLQTQLNTLIIGLRGSPEILAEIAAVSRFAAILAIFYSIVGDVGTGIVARAVTFRDVVSRYLVISSLFLAVGLLASILLYFCAPIITFLLGPEYSDLGLVILIVGIGTTLIMTGDVLRALNNARGWVRFSWLSIPLMLVWLSLGLFILDLTDVRWAAVWMASQCFIGLLTQSVVLASGVANLRHPAGRQD